MIKIYHTVNPPSTIPLITAIIPLIITCNFKTKYFLSILANYEKKTIQWNWENHKILISNYIFCGFFIYMSLLMSLLMSLSVISHAA